MTMTCLVLILMNKAQLRKVVYGPFLIRATWGGKFTSNFPELVIRRIHSSAWEKVQGEGGRRGVTEQAARCVMALWRFMRLIAITHGLAIEWRNTN